MNQSMDKLSLINLKLNSTLTDRDVINNMSVEDVERLTANQYMLEHHSKHDLNSTAKINKIYLNTMTPGKTVKFKNNESADRNEFTQSKVFKNESID